MEDFRIALFLDVWQHGWQNNDAMLAQANRLSMQQQLVALVESSHRPPPEKAARAEEDRGGQG